MCEELEVYQVGNMFFPGFRCNHRWSTGNLGRIVVGGDRGDVEATSAENETVDGEEGVMLYGPEFFTCMDCEGYNDEDLEGEVHEVVKACYDSIQEETFCQAKK